MNKKTDTQYAQEVQEDTHNTQKEYIDLKLDSDCQDKENISLESLQTASEAIRTMVNESRNLINTQSLQMYSDALNESLKQLLSPIREFVNSNLYQTIKESTETISMVMDKYREEFEALPDETKAIQDLLPFLKIELEEITKDPKFADYKLSDVLRYGFDDNGQPTNSKFKKIIQRAQKHQKEFESAEKTIQEIKKAAEEIPRIVAIPTNKVNFPLDKLNSNIWDLIEDVDPNGQMKLAVNTSKKGSKQDAVILYGIDFDNLETDLKIIKRLTPFDKRCYIAVGALFNAGNEFISPTQIYNMMGNSGKPQATDIKKITNSLIKMNAAQIHIDNTNEVKALKGYVLDVYHGSLMPIEIAERYINGQLCKCAIHPLREPPLISFAKKRNQITTLSRQLLESPISKTEANLRIDDYLLERISHMNNSKGNTPHKILYSTLFDHCKIKSTKQKQRAPEKIRSYLDHYKKCKWIKGYKEEIDGIIINL